MGKKIIIIITSFFSVVLIAYFGMAFFYSGHVFPNTKIGENDLSNCSADKVSERINLMLKDYTLTISGREGVNEQISAADAGLTFITDGYGEKIIDEQNIFAWPVFLFKHTVLEASFDITYDKAKLNQTLSAMPFMKEKLQIEPKDAYLSEYKSGEGFTIVPETPGTVINKETFEKCIDEALLSMKTELDLEQAGCYINPKILSDNKKLVKQADYLNKFVSTNLVYHFGKDEVIVDGDMVYDWMNINDKGKVTLDEEAIQQFAYSLGTKYDTIFRPRTFKTHYGTEVTIEKGDYGWWMNRPATGKELIEAIKEGKQGEMTPVYFQTAARYGSKDIGSTYVEINLTAQHLFVYKKGKLVLESDFVSGKATKDRMTPSGVYGITYKERDATLIGEDYETPVSYWMPFNGNIGLHDATWRNKFGANLYKSSGSHGCINLPFYIAEKIYGIVEKGTAVVCYELPGTESSGTTTQGDKEIAQFVVDAINRIEPVTAANKPKLEKTLKRVRDCYNDLTSKQKGYVKNLDKLEQAEKEFKEL